MGVYAKLGERLIDRGYGAIPIMPNTKRPGFLLAGCWIGLANWQRRFNGGVPAAMDRVRWGAGNSGLGVIGGYNGLVAVDIDTDDPAYRQALLKILPPSPVRKAGRKGETLFYHGPGIEKSQSWDIDRRRVVDLIGPGRQTVLPPTIHPDTHEPYRWLTTETLEDVAPEDLPELPADIADLITAALAPFGYRPEPAPHASNGGIGDGHGSSAYRQLNDLAFANLAVWVPALGLYRCRPARGGYEAVPMWRPSTTGRSPGKRHLNLKVVPAGIRDFGTDQGYTPIDLVMAACACDCDTAFRFLSERLAFGIDIDVSGLAPTQGMPAEAATESKPEPEAEVSPKPKVAPAEQADELVPFTTVPGLVGDIVDWISATARRPNRVLALSAAIAVVGTLIGRRVAGPTLSGTHLYVVAVARSGAGKQHMLDTAMRLMRAAKADSHIGPSRFHSGSAVFRKLGSMPVMLCVQDEVGAVIRAVTNRKASTHERAIGELLRSLWGISFGALIAPAWATMDDLPPVNCPAMSILGVSTSDEFTGSLQGESIDNGLLNRFLVLPSTARAGEVEPSIDPLTVPQLLAEGLHRLYLWSGPESLLHINDPTAILAPERFAWASTAAQTCYADFGRMVDSHTDNHPGSAPYLARCVETGVRLATIRAAGRWGRGGSVDLDDMEWGAGIAWKAAQGLATRAQDYVPTNERSDMAKKIAGLISRRGLMKPRGIQQFLKSRLHSREIKDILGQLVEAGEIEWTDQGYRPV